MNFHLVEFEIGIYTYVIVKTKDPDIFYIYNKKDYYCNVKNCDRGKWTMRDIQRNIESGGWKITKQNKIKFI